MDHTKPLLAVSSLGLGFALLLVAFHVQRDPFAFTSRSASFAEVLKEEASRVEPAAPLEPFVVVEEFPDQELGFTMRLEPVRQTPRPSRAAPPDIKAAPPPPCQPRWRELESGPEGRMVRELCPGFPAGSVPLS